MTYRKGLTKCLEHRHCSMLPVITMKYVMGSNLLFTGSQDSRWVQALWPASLHGEIFPCLICLHSEWRAFSLSGTRSDTLLKKGEINPLCPTPPLVYPTLLLLLSRYPECFCWCQGTPFPPRWLPIQDCSLQPGVGSTPALFLLWLTTTT